MHPEGPSWETQIRQCSLNNTNHHIQISYLRKCLSRIHFKLYICLSDLAKATATTVKFTADKESGLLQIRILNLKSICLSLQLKLEIGP